MKPKCFVLLIFLGVCGRSLTVSFSIDESKVKSYIVTRRTNPDDHDVFNVKMKDGHYCPPAGEVWKWCKSLSASFLSSWLNRSSCSCTCKFATRCFLPSLRTCISATLADNFGGECVQNQVLF